MFVCDGEKLVAFVIKPPGTTCLGVALQAAVCKVCVLYFALLVLSFVRIVKNGGLSFDCRVQFPAVRCGSFRNLRRAESCYCAVETKS